MLTFLNLEDYLSVGFHRQDVGLIKFCCHTSVDVNLCCFFWIL